MNQATEPTAEGKRRYPPTGYMTELRDPIPCVCKETCHRPCAGECGCEACSVQFSMFCDAAGFYDAERGSREEAAALAVYRGHAST